ncbi:hypothetical protein [Archaeoglobus sp.]|uniref:hypothetical protein n=1 Tax=Archaeoglobus sp. TaxID=1872626 RepID=UPI0025BCFD36|nr:hypothetical protein [Archaeoglobus sp.]
MVQIPFSGIHKEPGKIKDVYEVKPYSAIVYKEGDSVIAENHKGRKIADGEAGVDDAEVIQKALDSLTPNRSWKEKVALIGDFVINNSLVLDSYTIFKVIGKIRLADGVNKHMITADSKTDIEIYGELDGNRLNQTADSRGIYLYNCQNIKIRAKVKSTWHHGIHLSSCNTAKIFTIQEDIGWTAVGLTLSNDVFCKFIVDGFGKTERHSGVKIDGGSNIYFKGIVKNGTGNGVDLSTVNGAVKNVVVDVVSENNYRGIIVKGLESTGNNAEDVFIYGTYRNNEEQGIALANVVNSKIYANSYNNGQVNATGNPYGIRLYGSTGCSGIKVIGCRCYDIDGTQTYGIVEESNCDYNIIVNNDVRGNVTRGISFAGANTIVRRNIGYLTENSGTATFSGDGSKTQFSIAHSLVSTPSKVLVTPMTADAAGDFYVTADDTYIYINYSSAPASGTDNVKVSWYAEV